MRRGIGAAPDPTHHRYSTSWRPGPRWCWLPRSGRAGFSPESRQRRRRKRRGALRRQQRTCAV